MRYINLETWPRRTHFNRFSRMDYPYFSMCVNLDITAFHIYVKQQGFSFNIATIYVIARAANAISEFRQRIRDGKVVEHEVVHPSSTIMSDDELFSFCSFRYAENFLEFAQSAAEQISFVKENPTLEDGPGQDDLLFMTAIPWISFTSFMHPLNLNPADSVPRFAWGRFFEEGQSIKMPLSVQGHHALMDGLHMGEFYAELQTYLDGPVAVLGYIEILCLI